MVTRLQSGLFPASAFFTALKQLNRVPGHDGRYGVFVDELRMAIPSQQYAKIVEPGHYPLELYAVDEKNREGDFCFAYMIEECVLQILCAIGCHGRFFRFLSAVPGTAID